MESMYTKSSKEYYFDLFQNDMINTNVDLYKNSVGKIVKNKGICSSIISCNECPFGDYNSKLGFSCIRNCYSDGDISNTSEDIILQYAANCFLDFIKQQDICLIKHDFF